MTSTSKICKQKLLYEAIIREAEYGRQPRVAFVSPTFFRELIYELSDRYIKENFFGGIQTLKIQTCVGPIDVIPNDKILELNKDYIVCSEETLEQYIGRILEEVIFHE